MGGPSFKATPCFLAFPPISTAPPWPSSRHAVGSCRVSFEELKSSKCLCAVIYAFVPCMEACQREAAELCRDTAEIVDSKEFQ